MTNKVILNVDTASSQKITACLEIDKKVYQESLSGLNHKSESILALIEKILHKHELTLDAISAIKVNRGPGSFTGLRVGIAVVRVLGLMLGVEVNNKPPQQSIEPVYQSDKF